MIDQLRSEGHMIYINQNTGTNGNNTSYRIGTLQKRLLLQVSTHYMVLNTLTLTNRINSTDRQFVSPIRGRVSC